MEIYRRESIKAGGQWNPRYWDLIWRWLEYRSLSTWITNKFEWGHSVCEQSFLIDNIQFLTFNVSKLNFLNGGGKDVEVAMFSFITDISCSVVQDRSTALSGKNLRFLCSNDLIKRIDKIVVVSDGFIVILHFCFKKMPKLISQVFFLLSSLHFYVRFRNYFLE